jgi:hypothetical protein
MTYDPKRAVTVLFGGFGRDDSLLQDTWEWDGATWRHVTSEGPIGRWVNGLVYDSHLQAVVLHGASRASYDRAAGTAAGELWRWDGHHWNPIGDTPPISPQQPPVAMREGILYFFGWRNGAPPTTWFWNRRAWHQVEGPAPEPRRGAALAYDELRHVVLLHGGENDQRAFADLWEFDGRSWSRKDSRPGR